MNSGSFIIFGAYREYKMLAVVNRRVAPYKTFKLNGISQFNKIGVWKIPRFISEGNFSVSFASIGIAINQKLIDLIALELPRPLRVVHVTGFFLT